MNTTSRRIQDSVRQLLGAALLAALLAGTARAADYTWNGAVSGGWGSANWDATPAFDDQANIFFYASGAGNLSTFMGGDPRTIGSLTFTSNATSTVQIRLASSATGTTARDLTLGSAAVAPAITVDEGSSAIHYIGEAGGSVVLLNTLTVTHNGSAYLYINRPVTGNYGITTEGPGGLRLTAANSYTGKTVANNGRLVIASAAALGTDPEVFVADQLTLDGGRLDSSANITTLGNRGIALASGGGTFGPFSGITLTIDTPIAGVGALTKIGTSGTLVLSGDNSYSGGTTLNQHILRAGHDNAFGTGAVTFNSTATRLIVNNGVTITNAITVNGGSGVAGWGLIENSGASGNATISGGPITITGPASAGGHFAGRGAGGTLTIASPVNSSVDVTFRIGTGIFSGGGSYERFVIQQDTVRLGADNGLATSAELRLATAGAANFDLAGFNQQIAVITKASHAATIGNNSGGGVSTLTTTGTSLYAGVIQDTLDTDGGKVALTVNGGGLTLSGANSFTGPTTVSAGILQLGNGGTGGALSADSAISVAASATFTVNRSDTVTQGAEFSSAAITGAGGFSQAGSGTTILTAMNSFTGPTTVSAGTLQLGNGGTEGALSAASAISVAENATFSVNRTDTVTQGADFGSAPITGAGGFTQAGPGTTVLSSANSFTGPTTVTAGTLQLGADNANAASSPVVLADATLSMGGYANTAATLAVTGAAAIDLGSSGTLGFADSSAVAWTGTLILTGTLGATTLRFGEDADALTDDQLARIRCNGNRVSLDSAGYLAEGSSYTFYWDNNGTDAGFGTAGGTWAVPTVSQWSFSEAGTATPEASATTFPFVPVNFGTEASGLAEGTVTVSGTVEAGTILFGSASDAVTLAGGTIALADTTAITVHNSVSTIASTLGGATDALIKAGGGTLVLSGANIYQGATALSDGILEIANPLALQNTPLNTADSVEGSDTRGLRAAVTALTLGGLTGSKNLASLFSTTAGGYESLTGIALKIADGADLSYAGAIAGGAAGMTLTKKGAGTQRLTGASTFTGNLLIEAGTVKLGADDRLAAAAGLEIAANAPASATLDLNGCSQTLARLVFTATDSPGNLAVVGGDGSALTVNAAANTEIGPGGSISATRNVTLDLSGVNGFVWNGAGNVFRVGPRLGAQNSSAPGTSTVLLAGESTVTAASLLIGERGLNSNGGTSILRLGQANTLNANTINVGASGRSNATLSFRDGLENPAVTIRATNGASPVPSWDVGRVATFNNTTWTATVDFSGGELDALAGTLRIGIADSGTQTTREGIQNSFFTMGKGTLDAGALIIGLLTSGATGSTRNTYTANGTFTLDHADGIVKAGDLILGTKNSQVTGGTRSANGTFNLNAGAIEAESIGWGAQSGDGTTTRNFNFTGGTVRNRTGGDLTISNVPVTLTGSGSRVFEATAGHTITVASTAVISGAGLGFTKAGEGTLVLAAANTYTGATTVEAGTLLLGADGTLGTNNAVVLSGGTLSSGGFVNELGTLAVTGAAAIDLGDGTGPLSFLNCSEIAWTGTLALTGRLGATALRFGTDANALTPDQLSRITLRGLSVKITEDGYIATIPGTLIILF